MAAALCAAEGGGYTFPKSSGGIFKNFLARGYTTPYPLFPTPGLNIHLCTVFPAKNGKNGLFPSGHTFEVDHSQIFKNIINYLETFVEIRGWGGVG